MSAGAACLSVCRESIARCIEFANIRKKNAKRKTSKLFKDYLAGRSRTSAHPSRNDVTLQMLRMSRSWI
jgi:hypothetical protein